jgi:hypothetical protein
MASVNGRYISHSYLNDDDLLRNGHKNEDVQIQDHILAFQLLLQCETVRNWYHASTAVFEAFVEILVTASRSRREVASAANGEEKLDHVLRVAMLSFFHVDLYPRPNRFLSV